MTIVRTQVLTSPKTGDIVTSGSVIFKAPYDQPGPNSITVAKDFPTDPIAFVAGKLPDTDIPPGDYLVKIKVENATRRDAAGNSWLPITVGSTAVDLITAIAAFTQWTAPVVGAAQAAATQAGAARDQASGFKDQAALSATQAAQSAAGLAAITAGADPDFDTFAEVAAGKAPRGRVAATVTANATAPVNKLQPVDATSGAVTITLPTGQVEGTELTVAKSDSSANAVTVSGSIRGSASTINLVLAREAVVLRADSAGSWWPLSDHKTLSSLDGRYPTKAVADASYTPLVASVSVSGAAPTGSQWTSQQWGPAISGGAMLARGGVLTADATSSYIARNHVDGSSGEQTRWEAATRLSGGSTLIAQIVVDAPTDIDVWVDGRPVTYLPSVAAGNQYVRLDFLAPGSYDVDIALGNQAGFVQWFWDKTQSSIVAPAARDLWAIVGDSSVSGAAASEPVWAATVAHYISKVNGVDLFNLGQGQTGYVESSASYNGGSAVLGKSPYGSSSRRAALAALPALAGIIFTGGANDVTNGASSAVITAAAAAAYAQVASDRPGTPVIVFGVEPGQFAGLWSLSEVNRVNTAIAAAANAAPNVVSFIDMRAFPLVYGTGRSGSPQGDGNADWVVQSDGLHSTAKGAKFLGRWMARKVEPFMRRAVIDKRVRAVGDATYAPRTPAANYTYETAPDGSKRIKTEVKAGTTWTYVYDDANGGRIASQSDGTTTWTFAYDTDGTLTGVA